MTRCWIKIVAKIISTAVITLIDLFENKHIESVKIIGLSQAITKVILIVEVIKARIQNLHQTNQIDSIVARDKYDPNQTKNVPRVDILLSTKEPNEKGNGYQIPLNEIEFKKLCEIKSNIIKE